MVDSVDIEAFRKLKSRPSALVDRDPLAPAKTFVPKNETIPERVSPPRNLNEDPILKAWKETSAEIGEELPCQIKRKGPISLRLPDEHLSRLDKIPGKGMGSKVKYLLDHHSKVQETIKSQVRPLLSLITQVDKELEAYTKSISSTSELSGADGSRIMSLSKEIAIVFQLLSFDKDLHGKLLTPKQNKTLSFALGLRRGQ